MNLINISESERKENKKCLGIDFGTTNSVCSIKLDDKLLIVEDKKKNKIIPTVVSYSNDSYQVGNDIDKTKKHSEKIYSIKRFFTISPDKKLFEVNENVKKSPSEISKDFFIYLKDISKNFLNESITDCVLTVPAYFDEKARSGIMRSAFLAGFNVRRLINEPTAAAFAYGLEKKRRGIFLVYDLGGGTFDVSLLKLSDGIFKVIGSSGEANLGGDDFDYLFAKKMLMNNLKLDIGQLDNSDQINIVKQFKFIKEELSKKNSFQKEIIVKNKKIKTNFDLSDLDSSISHLVNKTINITKDLIKECEIEESKINGFILVGGSTRLKIIENEIKKTFCKKIYNDINPDLVVSKGAAFHGFEILNGATNLLLDVTPLSLGIETMGGLTEKIIPRNTPLPCVMEQSFTTNENGQTSIKITIVQGERETTSNNNLLGEFILSGLEPKPAGIPRIKVTFSLDTDGILFVSAVDESSGIENSLVIKTHNDLSLDEMKSIVESSIKNAKKDIDLRLLIETKVKATKFINEVINVKSKMEQLLSKNDYDKINGIIKLMKNEIKKDNKEKIDELIEKLNNSTKKFAQKMIDKNFSEFVGKKIDLLEK
jgi:molecular chaperone HscA